MATDPYPYKLPDNDWNGEISGVRLSWPPGAQNKLLTDAPLDNLPTQVAKALTENFAYLCGYRLGKAVVKISAPPHTFTIDSKTGQVRTDGLHLSILLSGSTGTRSDTAGRYAVHIYLAPVQGTHEYEVVLETVRKNLATGSVLVPELGTGNHALIPAMTVQSSASGSMQGNSQTSTASVAYGQDSMTTAATSGYGYGPTTMAGSTSAAYQHASEPTSVTPGYNYGTTTTSDTESWATSSAEGQWNFDASSNMYWRYNSAYPDNTEWTG